MRKCAARLVPAVVLACAWAFAPSAQASERVFVTGEAGGTGTIFEVVFTPGSPGASVVPRISTGLRPDGIDLLPGGPLLVVGEQVGAPPPFDGAITVYDHVVNGPLPPLLAATGAGTRPSTVLTVTAFGGHVYYIENQFGFAPGPHRIMRVGIGGGAPEVVFDAGALAGILRLEGLELDGSRLYFFGSDTVIPLTRALYSIGLGATGLHDGFPHVRHLGGLAQGPPGDGADELDLDPATGILYGSNIVSGEIIFWDPSIPAGGLFIPAAAMVTPKLMRLSSMMADGIRATGAGHLVLSGIAGVLLSVDIAGVLADGPTEDDITIHYDEAVSGLGYSFDDISPITTVEVPALSGASRLALAALVALLGAPVLAWRRSTR